MNILHVADRLSLRGGADLHLRDLLKHQAQSGPVTLVVGRVAAGASVPPGVALHRCRALASPIASGRGLARLAPLLDRAEVVHVHNLMNPTALARVVATGRSVVTVQDHRVFCPGPGRTLPDGRSCDRQASLEVCEACLPDLAYRERTLALTEARRLALQGARLVVLSRYMADELRDAGLGEAVVIPPPVRAAGEPSSVGDHYLLGGRLVNHKGVMAAWQAWSDAGRPQPLRVCGEGSLAGSLEGAENLGWLERDAWRSSLRRARALILTPSWQEPFGIAGLEALSEGTPVVGWCTGGMADWEGSGLLRVPVGDTAGLSSLLAQLSLDDEQVRLAGHAGWKRVSLRPSVESLHTRLEAVYTSVVRP